MITGVTLADYDRNLTMPLYPVTGIYVSSIDSVPAVREVTEDRPGADGSIDRTEYLTTAAVTIDMTLSQTFRAVLDQLNQYLAPWARPWLIVSDDEWTSDRRIQLRADTGSRPYTAPDYPAVLRVQMQWKAPAGVWEDTALSVYEIASDVPDVTGLAFTAATGLAFTAAAGMAFSPSTAHASTLVTVRGSARPSWSAKLYGPVTGPKLTRDDLGVSVAFTDDMVIPAGDYVEISSARTANYLSDPASSRLTMIDFANSTWWTLDPATTAQIRYHGTSGTGPTSVAELTFTPLWIA